MLSVEQLAERWRLDYRTLLSGTTRHRVGSRFEDRSQVLLAIDGSDESPSHLVEDCSFHGDRVNP